MPIEWDVSRPVAQAYSTGAPLRLALYSADRPAHSGKHFISSDIGAWNAQGRPTLEIQLGTPVADSEIEKVYLPLIIRLN